MKRRVAILIRVYDRIEDLKYNLQIIRRTWTEFDYHIIVISNGYPDGYRINAESVSLIDNLIVLEHNAGHKKGNSQLLIEGQKYIPVDCDYTVILEADTWMYTDRTVKEYVEFMEEASSVVWSSADWYDKDYALAVDFAVIKSDFIRQNPKLFDFEIYPECYIANYLRDANVRFKWITENMPVHVPSYVSRYPYVDDSTQRRFYVFPKSKMVTHHIEFLKGGMPQKKRYFNTVANYDFFEEEPVSNKGWERFKMYFWTRLSYLFIKKSWFQKKYYRDITQ
ncbi:glycosyltransferase [Dysgonomonas sp. GY617]|uniref:glycosyltransferase n=1 Tax=Dysgonomonas sp. GY617 TaxID=2780420 RepID=UPI0018841C23|nr:glycosyltransferase family 2 protein [Dysgonomonas sp. GY617]MBF0575414.1 glycosyltransferase family 2 protein [Dysgonomonas sp. GY617]